MPAPDPSTCAVSRVAVTLGIVLIPVALSMSAVTGLSFVASLVNCLVVAATIVGTSLSRNAVGRACRRHTSIHAADPCSACRPS